MTYPSLEREDGITGDYTQGSWGVQPGRSTAKLQVEP